MQTRSVFQSVGELDQLREMARGASLEIAQLAPGVMQGVIAHADLGTSSVHTNCFSLPARGRGSLAPDRWTFVVFPKAVDGQFNSLRLDSDRMLAYPPGEEFEGTISSHFQDWVFTIRFEELARACKIISQQDISHLSSHIESLSPDPKCLDRLRDFAKYAMALTENSPAVFADARIRQTLHVRLVSLLSRAVLSASTDRRRRSGVRDSHSRIVRKAEDYLDAALGGPIALADLCSATNVSERTLRSAFLNVVGVGPNAYLRVIRLNRVRVELERSLPTQTTVSSVAMRWGLYHFGRFAHEYKQFFGERPSETLLQSGRQ